MGLDQTPEPTRELVLELAVHRQLMASFIAPLIANVFGDAAVEQIHIMRDSSLAAEDELALGKLGPDLGNKAIHFIEAYWRDLEQEVLECLCRD